MSAIGYDDVLSERRATAVDPCDLSVLRCPLTGQPVRFGTDTTVVTHDGQISHPVLDGVICLTVAAAQPANRLTLSRQELHPITAGLQRFYDDQQLGARLRHGSGIDEQAARERAGFHFLSHSAAWFLSRQWPFAPRILVWRLASVPALKLYVHRWLGGRWLLRALFRAENRWPKRLGLRASYPLIVIDRAADARTLSVPRVGGYA